MDIAVRVEPDRGSPPPEVEYRWDADTDILCASVRARRPRGVREGAPPPAAESPAPAGAGGGGARSIEVEGRDGSWLVLDVAGGGGLAGVEIAVWPDVRRRGGLRPPDEVEDARVTLPPLAGAGAGGAAIEAHEVTTALLAESDDAERTIHFRLGPARPTRAVRIARDILLDIDARGRLAGVWLLNVPPCPQPT